MHEAMTDTFLLQEALIIENKKPTRGAGGLGLTPRRRSKYLAPEGGKGCCVPVIPHFKTEC